MKTEIQKTEIEILTENYLKKLEVENKKSSSLTNKSLIVEIMLQKKLNRVEIPVYSAGLYFTKTKQVNISTTSFSKKVESIKNSLDTIISNYNFPEKIKNDFDLHNYKLIEDKSSNSFKLISK